MLTSAVGGICTLLLMFILLAYAGWKFSVLVGKSNSNVFQAVSKDYFDETEVMSGEQDLKVAVAVYSPQESPQNVK